MRLCFDCLLCEQPDWARRYRFAWIVLLLFGAAAFQLPYGTLGIAAQGAFFLMAIGWAVWPLFAAMRPRKRNCREVGW